VWAFAWHLRSGSSAFCLLVPAAAAGATVLLRLSIIQNCARANRFDLQRPTNPISSLQRPCDTHRRPHEVLCTTDIDLCVPCTVTPLPSSMHLAAPRQIDSTATIYFRLRQPWSDADNNGTRGPTMNQTICSCNAILRAASVIALQRQLCVFLCRPATFQHYCARRLPHHLRASALCVAQGYPSHN
jgi:hypothetical protein